jgi:RNase H-fold protein (predicted Holliday junction resolvase)
MTEQELFKLQEELLEYQRLLKRKEAYLTKLAYTLKRRVISLDKREAVLKAEELLRAKKQKSRQRPKPKKSLTAKDILDFDLKIKRAHFDTDS